MNTIENRLAEIERRLATLEAREAGPAPLDISLPPVPTAPSRPLLQLTVSNKRFAPADPGLGSYEDHIWFDCSYLLSNDSKATRAVKGVIEFSDLFGEVKFRLNATLSDPLVPGKPFAQPGIGFTFNQFMGDHQWMLATALKDMKFSFRALSILYGDGTTESFA